MIILSERAARFLFPGRSPIGGQVRHNTNGMADPWSRVVGVVGNVRYKADETSEGMEMYYPSAQWEFESAYVAIRFQGSPAGFENADSPSGSFRGCRNRHRRDEDHGRADE